MWGAHPPSLYHVLLSPNADPVVRYIALNTTNTTASEIAAVHTERKFESVDVYTGVWNPWTGVFAKTGLSLPFAYVLHLFSMMPGWAPMLIISLISRTFMARQGPRQAELHRQAREAAGEGSLRTTAASEEKPEEKKQ